MTHKNVAVVALAIALLTVGREQPHGIGISSEGEYEPAMPASQLASLRGATARFHRLDVALAEGYTAFGGCFADPAGSGAMGYHYVNDALVRDPAIDPLRFYLLHAWIWKNNPSGIFGDWNPKVRCD